jgi:signal transduction histidine kinase
MVRIDLAAAAPTITVEDQGTGLHPSIEQRLFVPFASHKSQGIGLGLALARRILDLHGATLELENREGAGARAVIRFPVSSVVDRDLSAAV